MKKWIFAMFMVFFLGAITQEAYALIPYEGYNYDDWEDVTPSPVAYIPESNLSGTAMGTGLLNQPSDLFIDAEGKVYIVDTNNNRIVILDQEFRFQEEILSFMNQDQEDHFNKPSSIYVNNEGNLYIADTENMRIVVLDQEHRLKTIIENPTSETFAADFKFLPVKVGVDFANRVYVIAKGVFQGIMSFDENGKFYGYVGTINVSVNPIDILWRSLSTKEQRKKQVLFIPTEFTGLDLDEDGFIYTTNVDNSAADTIKRLNPSGNDVLKKKEIGSVSGDLLFRPFGLYSGATRFTDIAVNNVGIYSGIDTTRGRIFTYDHEGNLLYIFGGLGNQVGTFKKPVAIEYQGDKILVLDQERGEIVIFRPTRYGQLINEAVTLRYNGDEEQAVYLWEEVLKLDANFELAYVGIGKSLLAKGDNKEAMRYLKLGMDQKHYSVAYKRYRNEVLKANMGYGLTGAILFILFLAIRRVIKKIRTRSEVKHA